MIPGSEPILLDLEKLFLPLDSVENQKLTKKTILYGIEKKYYLKKYYLKKIQKNPKKNLPKIPQKLY